MKLTKYLFFFLLLFFVMQWTIVSLYFTSFGQKQELIKKINKFPLQNIILEKTGVRIDSLQIINSDHPYGAMVGIPGAPYLILSKYLYEKFSPKELEYVLLHETGHYAMNHAVKEGVVFFLLFAIGSVVVHKIKAKKRVVFGILILGLIFGIALIQLGRKNEYEADHYAANRISDPQGMILATQKFQNFYGPKFTYGGNSFFIKLFYRSVPYSDRILIAKEEITRRK